MAKKNEISLNVITSNISGIFDKNELGDYIIIVDDCEYELKDLEEYLLGGSISITNSRIAKDG